MNKWFTRSLIGFVVLLLIAIGIVSYLGKERIHPFPYWVTDIKIGDPMCIRMKNSLGKTLTYSGAPSSIWPLLGPLRQKDGKIWVYDISPFQMFRVADNAPACRKAVTITKAIQPNSTQAVKKSHVKKAVFLAKKPCTGKHIIKLRRPCYKKKYRTRPCYRKHIHRHRPCHVKKRICVRRVPCKKQVYHRPCYRHVHHKKPPCAPKKPTCVQKKLL